MKTNGKIPARRCESWIDTFVKTTEAIHSPELFRKWTAITTISAVVEQRVWLRSGGALLYPNLYTFLVGHPGVGKSRVIKVAKAYLREVPEFHMAPTSMTAASLIDALVDSKRLVLQLPEPPLEYNSMTIAADEIGAFMHKYDDEMVAVLSEFYDNQPYGQRRRGKDLNIKMKSPHLIMLCGTTPSNLLKLLPEGAWDQGFMSRIILAFSDERIVGDDFANVIASANEDLIHDLKHIAMLVGEVKVTDDFRNIVMLWREQGEEFEGQPKPSHPKLIHYNTRRRAHLYKLATISCIDRSDVLLLTRDDFNRAMSWLVEVEAYMPDIFKAAGAGADSGAMDEIYHYAKIAGKITEAKLVNFARERVPAHSVMRVIEIMEKSGMIKPVSLDPKTGMRVFIAINH